MQNNTRCQPSIHAHMLLPISVPALVGLRNKLTHDPNRKVASDYARSQPFDQVHTGQIQSGVDELTQALYHELADPSTSSSKWGASSQHARASWLLSAIVVHSGIEYRPAMVATGCTSTRHVHP